jgi:tripartite ATP-independent transporter DctM subunit
MTAAILFSAMLLLFALNVPIGIGLGLAGVAGLLTFPRVGIEVLASRMFYGLDSFLILSVPLFLLLGEIMDRARITERLVAFAEAAVGHLRGGMGHVAIVSNMVMSGISGSGAADAAATGTVLVPAMTRVGFRPSFAAALIGAAATIGPIIPPSIIMVIYASIANVSVGRMFIGGLVPGVLMGLCLMLITAVIARRHDLPRGVRFSATTLTDASRRASLVLLAPVIVIAGIALGVFTATESAGIACAYALALGMLAYRTIALRDLPGIFQRTALATGRVMFVLATASVFSWILARAGAPALVAQLPMFAPEAPAWVVLLSLNLLLLVLGCLMDAIAILLIITPMILPIALKANIDPVHLGVVMSVNLSIGLVTPPFGTVMFILSSIARCSIAAFSSDVWIFVVALLCALLLTTFLPVLVLALPDLLLG